MDKENIEKYTPLELAYIKLELKKLFENHHNVPTVFIYPSGRFMFNGIIDKKGDKVDFVLSKKSIDDFWTVKIIGEKEQLINTLSQSVYESLVFLVNKEFL